MKDWRYIWIASVSLVKGRPKRKILFAKKLKISEKSVFIKYRIELFWENKKFEVSDILSESL